MSFSHDVLSATQVFNKNLHFLAQQHKSKLEDAVRIESMNAASQFFDRVGEIEMLERTSRHQDTAFTPVPYSRRRVDVRNFEVSDLIDKEEDAVKMMVDPQSATSQTFLKAGNRNMDKIIIDSLLGSAVATDAEFSVTNVAAQTALASGSTNMRADKIKNAIEQLMVDDVDLTEDKPYLVITPSQYGSLLRESEFINKDFRLTANTQLGVSNVGEILGVDIRIVSPNLLPKTSNDRTCILFTKGSCVVGLQNRFSIKTLEDPTKGGSLRIIAKQNFGAVRMEESRVLPILCDESAT